jgi:hypothetical protein
MNPNLAMRCQRELKTISSLEFPEPDFGILMDDHGTVPTLTTGNQMQNP